MAGTVLQNRAANRFERSRRRPRDRAVERYSARLAAAARRRRACHATATRRRGRPLARLLRAEPRHSTGEADARRQRRAARDRPGQRLPALAGGLPRDPGDRGDEPLDCYNTVVDPGLVERHCSPASVRRRSTGFPWHTDDFADVEPDLRPPGARAASEPRLGSRVVAEALVASLRGRAGAPVRATSGDRRARSAGERPTCAAPSCTSTGTSVSRSRSPTSRPGRTCRRTTSASGSAHVHRHVRSRPTSRIAGCGSPTRCSAATELVGDARSATRRASTTSPTSAGSIRRRYGVPPSADGSPRRRADVTGTSRDDRVTSDHPNLLTKSRSANDASGQGSQTICIGRRVAVSDTAVWSEQGAGSVRFKLSRKARRWSPPSLTSRRWVWPPAEATPRSPTASPRVRARGRSRIRRSRPRSRSSRGSATSRR